MGVWIGPFGILIWNGPYGAGGNKAGPSRAQFTFASWELRGRGRKPLKHSSQSSDSQSGLQVRITSEALKFLMPRLHPRPRCLNLWGWSLGSKCFNTPRWYQYEAKIVIQWTHRGSQILSCIRITCTKYRLPGPPPEPLIRLVWTGSQESAFLTSSLVKLMLLVLGPHFENHCALMLFKLSGEIGLLDCNQHLKITR